MAELSLTRRMLVFVRYDCAWTPLRLSGCIPSEYSKQHALVC